MLLWASQTQDKSGSYQCLWDGQAVLIVPNLLRRDAAPNHPIMATGRVLSAMAPEADS
jgi:hypothetical protein